MLRQYENQFNLLRRPANSASQLPAHTEARLSEVNASAADQNCELTKGQERPSEVKRG